MDRVVVAPRGPRVDLVGAPHRQGNRRARRVHEPLADANPLAPPSPVHERRPADVNPPRGREVAVSRLRRARGNPPAGRPRRKNPAPERELPRVGPGSPPADPAPPAAARPRVPGAGSLAARAVGRPPEGARAGKFSFARAQYPRRGYYHGNRAFLPRFSGDRPFSEE